LKQTAWFSASSNSSSSGFLFDLLNSKLQYFANNSGLLFLFSPSIVTVFVFINSSHALFNLITKSGSFANDSNTKALYFL